MAFDVGRIEAQLGYEHDTRGLRAWDVAVGKARVKAKNDIVQEVKVDVNTDGMDRLRKAWKEIGDGDSQIAAFNRSFSLFRNLFAGARSGAMAAGMALAADGVGSLGAAAVATTSALGPLSGAAVALPGIFGAVGQAVGVLSLAQLPDLTEALKGNEEAMKRLSPAGKQMVDDLKKLKPELDKLRKEAQQPIFKSLDKALEDSIKNLPVFRQLIGDTSKEMGSIIEDAGKWLGSDAVGRDLGIIGKGNVKLLDNMGEAGLNLADAFRHVMVAAQPFLRWLGEATVRLSEWIEKGAQTARRNGDLEQFFEATRRKIKQVVDIGSSLVGTLLAIGDASRPLGNTLLRDLEKGADDLERWAVINKEGSIKQFFEDAKPAVREVAGLVGDLVKAFFDMQSPEEFTSFIKHLREDMVPALQDFLETVRSGLGPQVSALLSDFLRLVTTLVAEGGPLSRLIQFLDLITRGLTGLFNAIPASEHVLSGILGAGLITATIAKFVGFGKKLGSAFGLAVSSSAAASIGGTAVAGGAGVGGAVAGGALTGTAVGGMNVIAGSSAGGIAGKISGVLSKVKWARVGLVGAGITIADSVFNEFETRAQERAPDVMTALEGLSSHRDVRVGLFEEGGSSWNPFDITIGASAQEEAAEELKVMLQGIVDSGGEINEFDRKRIDDLRKQVEFTDAQNASLDALVKDGEKLHRQAMKNMKQEAHAARQLDLGPPGAEQFFGHPKAASHAEAAAQLTERTRDNMKALERGAFTSMDNIRKVMKDNTADISQNFEKGTDDWRFLMVKNLRAGVQGIKQAWIDGEIGTKKAIRSIEKLTDRADLLEGKDPLGLARGFKRSWKEAGNINEKALDRVTSDLKKMPKDAQREAAQMMIRMARSLVKEGKLPRAALDRLKEDFQKKFGDVKDQGVDSTYRLMAGVLQNMGGLVGGFGIGLGIIEKNANNALGSLGQGVDPIKWVIEKVGDLAQGKGQKKGARGGLTRVAGRGLDDSVPLAADTIVAPGEDLAVINRHQRPLLDQAVANQYGVAGLDGFFGRYDRKHSAPRGYQEGGLTQALGPYTIPPIQYDPNHAGGNSHWHISGSPPDWVVGIGHQLQRMGFDVGEHPAFGGVTTDAHGHYGPTDHYHGGAIDVNSAADETREETTRVAALLRGAGGAIGAGVVDQISKILLKGPDGPLKDIAQGALDNVRKETNEYLSKQVPDVGTGVGGSGTISPQQFMQLANQAIAVTSRSSAFGRFDPSEFSASGLLTLAQAESGLQVNSINDWDSNAAAGNPSGGLMHLTQSNMQAYAEPSLSSDMFDAISSIAASINYQRERYGSQVTHSPYEGGGLITDLGGKHTIKNIKGIYEKLATGPGKERTKKLEKRMKELLEKLKKKQKKITKKAMKKLKKLGIMPEWEKAIELGEERVLGHEDTAERLGIKHGGTEAPSDLESYIKLLGITVVDPVSGRTIKPENVEWEQLNADQQGDIVARIESEWAREQSERDLEIGANQNVLQALLGLRQTKIDALDRGAIKKHKYEKELDELEGKKGKIKKFEEREKDAERDARQIKGEIDRLKRKLKDVGGKGKEADKARNKIQNDIDSQESKLDKANFAADQAKKQGDFAKDQAKAIKEGKGKITDFLEGVEENLDDIQGPNSPKYKVPFLDALPPLTDSGTPIFGGQILSVQDTLRSLGAMEFTRPDFTPEPGETDTEARLREIDKEIIKELQRERLVRIAQDPIFSMLTTLNRGGFAMAQQAPPFAGSFHQGGVVPGPPGQEYMALVRGQERIEASGAAPSITVEINGKGVPLDQLIDVRIRDAVQQQATKAGVSRLVPSPRGLA